MQKSYNDTTPKVVGGIILTAIVCIGIYFIIVNMNSGGSDTLSSSDRQQAVTSTTSDASDLNIPTKDGQYSSTISYSVPENGQNSISVKVTITSGKISDIEDSISYDSRESREYNDSFDSSIKGEVVGKKLDQISLSGVGGASLTTEAFMQALSEISTAAKS